jgi:Methyltransferase domain
MLTRTDIINALILRLGLSSYLEIGLGDGQNFQQIMAPLKECVDPGGGQDGAAIATYQLTSDEFFAVHGAQRYDLIFIDGLHHECVVERDIYNSLKLLNKGGVIVCHDMNPENELMQRVPRECIEWTGDGWRAWLKIRAANPQLLMFVLDTDHGVGVIYPQGQPITSESDLHLGLSFAEFMEQKQRWLPLVPSFDLWEHLLVNGEMNGLTSSQ